MKWNFTADDVRKRRDETGESMMTAKAHFEEEQVRAAIRGMRNGNHSWSLLADILLWLVERRT